MLPDVPVDAALTGPRGQPCNVHVRSSESQFTARLFKISVAIACYINNVTKAARLTMLSAYRTAWLDSRSPPQAWGQPCLCTDAPLQILPPSEGHTPCCSGLSRGHRAQSLSCRDGGHAAGGVSVLLQVRSRGSRPLLGTLSCGDTAGQLSQSGDRAQFPQTSELPQPLQ